MGLLKLVCVILLTFSFSDLCFSACCGNCEPEEPPKNIQQCSSTDDTVLVSDEESTLLTPSNFPKTCTFRFPRQADVCQLKLEYEQLEISLPNAVSHDCSNDYLSIRGSPTTNTLKICGKLYKGEHMYLDFAEGSDIQIQIRTLNKAAPTYGYKIKVTQIKCGSEERVPAGCLQYYTKGVGTVRSFNFPQAQLNDQFYKVCIRKTDSHQLIEWKACDDSGIPPSSTFCIIGGNCNLDFGVPEGIPCIADFLNFPSHGKVCRPRFPIALRDTGFSFYVHFDTQEPKLPAKSIMESSSERTDFPGRYCNLTALGPPPSGYLPWKLSEDSFYCESSPIYSIVDTNNSGFCLSYNVISLI